MVGCQHHKRTIKPSNNLMTFIINIVTAYVFIMTALVSLWLVSKRIRDVSIVDMFWGAGFGLVALLLYAVNQPSTTYGIALVVMPVAWALRYSIHVISRNWGHGEDARYTKLRSWVDGEEAFNRFALRKVFILQGNLMFVVALPIIIGLGFRTPPVFPVLVWVGAAIWLIGFLMEMTADIQLKAFRADTNKRGTILNTGLWRYSRHPNYFGNSVLWFGIFIAACAQPWAVLTIVGPIVMTYYLIKVTGVATLEKKMSREKPAYKAYMESTSMFVPWFPKLEAT